MVNLNINNPEHDQDEMDRADFEERIPEESRMEILPFADEPEQEPNIDEIKLWIWQNAAGHLDPNTLEINCTSLAEEAANHFGHPDWLDDSQHVVWDLAVDMGELTEKLTARLMGRIDNLAGDIRQRMEQDPIDGHHADCQCSRCQIGDDSCLWMNHPEEY